MVLIFTVIIGWLIWWTTRPRPVAPISSDQQSKIEASVAQAQKDGNLRDNAEAEVKKGDTTKAAQLYSTAIADETDAVRKVQLYIDQSGVLYAAGKYPEAFTAAKQAETLTQDKFLVADWLSRLYEDQKDYKDAAAYYILAGQWATSPENKTALTKAYYDAQAARMDQLAAGGVQ